MSQETALELTPKNLYRLMTGKLCLADQRLSFYDVKVKGLTLVTFWRSLMTNVLSDETLEVLFPKDGTHPRIQSNLMNRTGPNPMPRVLRVDLGTRFTQYRMLSLVSNCSAMLIRLNYDFVRFHSVFDTFEVRCAGEDLFLNSSAQRHLQLIRSDYTLPFDGKHSPVLFRDGLRLAWNCLYAFFGTELNGEEFRRIRTDQLLMPAALWELLCRDSVMGQKLLSTLRLTGKLAGDILPEKEYVPTSLTPERLLQLLTFHHKLLLTGIGGSGKTQLACQLVSQIQRQDTYQSLMLLSLNGTLTVSFAEAFPDLIQNRAENPLEAVWEKLNLSDRTLLILDGVDEIPTDYQAFQTLGQVSCDVLIVGRLQAAEGFFPVFMPSLSEDEAVQFLRRAGKEAFAEEAGEDLVSLTDRLGCHPLTLRLIGSLCCTHYMTAQDVIRELDNNGFRRMRIKMGQEQASMASMLNALFFRNPLSDQDRMLLRLFAMLPDQSWRPTQLREYTLDLSEEDFPLANRLESLALRGLLQRAQDGYRMHPVVAEVFRSDGISAEDFPLLWDSLKKAYQEDMSKELQARFSITLSLIRCTEQPSGDALAVLDQLCATVMTRPRYLAQPWLLERYRIWLERLSHTSSQEIDLISVHMLWCVVLPWRDQLNGLAERLLEYKKEDLLNSRHYILLVNDLEIGGQSIRKELLQELFERLRPGDEPIDRLINYLNFYGGAQRSCFNDPMASLRTLTEARELIDTHDYRDTVEDATNDTRRAYALADLHRYEETLPLMTRVLSILQSRGYAEDSPTIISSRNSLHFFRAKCGVRIAARDELKRDIERWEKKGPPWDEAYISVMENYVIILQELYQLQEAEEVSRKILDVLDEMPEIPVSLLAIGLHRMGETLRLQNRNEEALGYLMRAETLYRKDFSIENPHLQTCRRHMAQAMIALGMTEEGSHILAEIKETQGRES